MSNIPPEDIAIMLVTAAVTSLDASTRADTSEEAHADSQLQALIDLVTASTAAATIHRIALVAAALAEVAGTLAGISAPEEWQLFLTAYAGSAMGSGL